MPATGNIATGTCLASHRDNQAELEAVLSHYAVHPEDSLHLKAAQFLIANMTEHFTPINPYIYQSIRDIDSLHPHISNVMRRTLHNIPFKTCKANMPYKKLMDVQTIKGSFLIEHIDNAIRMWHTCPWLKYFTFENFCEYLLPYRTAYEPLTAHDASLRWWTILADTLAHYGYEPKTMTELKTLHRELLKNGERAYFNNLRLSPSSDALYTFDCIDLCYYRVSRLRAFGIPSAIDFIPAWPHRNGGHAWHVIFEPRFADRNLCDLPLSGPAAKVWRVTYESHPIPRADREEHIPPLFRMPFYKDVTAEYVPTSDVHIAWEGKAHPAYAYLSVFNNQQWTPVAWAETNGQQATFRNMGQGIVYLPVCFNRDSMKNIGFPFFLTQNGETHSFIPDPGHPATLRLRRKYPLNDSKILWGENLKGCYIEASDRADFSAADTICLITQTQCELGPFAIQLPATKPYRYWRISHPGNFVSVADWQLFDAQGEKAEGVLLAPQTNMTQRGAFDDNPLTFVHIRDWIGIDLGKSRSIRSMQLRPRTDDNGIVPGQTYELFYYDKDGWRSAGRQEAQSDELEFTNVPFGALYWLRNLTAGREERIFTYENGRMRFW